MKIDEQLIRRRAEHNDGELSTLKEVTLHQFDIEKIENLETYCRGLEILYLQNNLIGRIENLGKLKALRYLNLALNNIKLIENLEGCESLEKLDLTVNFIENPLCIDNLANNIMLRELFLVGNPVTKVEGYREYAICTLPFLKALDGKEVEKSERLWAQQSFAKLKEKYEAKFPHVPRITKKPPPVDEAALEETRKKLEEIETKGVEELKEEFNNKAVPYTPESRLETARAIQKMKGITDEKPKQTKREIPKEPETLNGRVLQKNEGKWNFWWTDEDNPDSICLHVEISKYLDSSFIDVDPHPTWIRVVIKEKLLQLTLDEEILPDQVHCERSKLSGLLVVTMKKASSTREEGVEELVHIRKREQSKLSTIPAKILPKAAKSTRAERLFGPGGKPKIMDKSVVARDATVHEDFVDDPEVPPLC
ncbi:Protein tilB [Phlyctochytrium bullatum]|nr:Protein tilB [Phlyctochytrium bullatum]